MKTHLIFPAENAVVPLHTKMQRDFRRQQHHTAYEGSIDWVHPERTGVEDGTYPLSVRFRWETNEAVSLFRLSESGGFSSGNEMTVRGNTCVLKNFKIGTRYFWQVNNSEVRSFVTEDIAPRFICANGPSNVRDLGGWKTTDGKRIRQGLLFRCGMPDTFPGDNGHDVFCRQLGVRCEIDLRREFLGTRSTSFIGESVRYLLLPCDGYEPFLIQKSECKAIMETIADSSNYPLVFHCTGGADRTGTTAFMLLALCGVDYDDLLLDYELTTLSVWGERSRNAEYFRQMLTALRTYGDENTPWSILVERFFLDCGISAETIAALKANLTESFYKQ